MAWFPMHVLNTHLEIQGLSVQVRPRVVAFSSIRDLGTDYASPHLFDHSQ